MVGGEIVVDIYSPWYIVSYVRILSFTLHIDNKSRSILGPLICQKSMSVGRIGREPLHGPIDSVRGRGGRELHLRGLCAGEGKAQR